MNPDGPEFLPVVMAGKDHPIRHFSKFIGILRQVILFASQLFMTTNHLHHHRGSLDSSDSDMHVQSQPIPGDLAGGAG